ncbi:MAG: PorT family protein [Fimbriimonadaceae bacterium]|nr:PorT family protein [Chitinophagales bacterium]
MKKYFIIACVLMLSSVLKAQMNFGIKGGLNFTTLNSKDDVSDYNFLPSYYAGVLAHMHISEDFAFQPELLFSAQGAKYDILGEKATINLGYINLPLLFQFMFLEGLRLESGPQAGLLIMADSKFLGTTTDIKDDLNALDLSWVFGVGYVTDSGLGIDLRYNTGLTNISEVEPPTIKNSVIALGLFFQFSGAGD